VPDPSPEWTPDERLAVLDYLAKGLSKHSEGVLLVKSAVVTAVTEQMTIVATYPTQFLEENREQVLTPIEENIHRWGRP
jgi:hypothetical protein